MQQHIEMSGSSNRVKPVSHKRLNAGQHDRLNLHKQSEAQGVKFICPLHGKVTAGGPVLKVCINSYIYMHPYINIYTYMNTYIIKIYIEVKLHIGYE